MRSITVSATLLLVSLVLLGCGKSSTSNARPGVQVAQAPGIPEKAGAGASEVAAPPTARKIIYTSQIDVVVEDMNLAQQKLILLIDAMRAQGGFLARQEVTGTNGQNRRGTWTIRVPLAIFEGFVTEVERLGELERSSRDAQDVTEAYVDTEGRLRIKESSEHRLLSHLKKSALLKDTLELERELSRVRGEVEQLQGQLNLLKSRTHLAIVALTMHEHPGFLPAIQPTFSAFISRTFYESWKSLVSFGQVLTLVAVALSLWLSALEVLGLPMLLVRRSLVSVWSGFCHGKS